MILGVDPGTTTGMACFTDGKLTGLGDCTSVDLLRFLCETEIDHVILEDSRLQSHIWNAGGKDRPQAMRVARNVGSIDRICAQVEEICVSRDISLLMISPRAKGGKTPAEEFKAVTGWTGRTNEHQRDAAMIAWNYRNLAPEKKL
jgi:predicted RNase H-like nuclease (RuvC/YqgF family)